MAKRTVRCKSCGRLFSPSQGGRYDSKRSCYYCPTCAREPGTPAVRRPSLGGTIAKVAFGLLFFAVSFSEPESGDRLSYFLVSMVVALALIAWGLIPWLRVWKEDRRSAAEEKQRREELAWQREEEKRRRQEEENKPRTCPACGATSRGKVCEYCGSSLV